jgi:hypothetical protein
MTCPPNLTIWSIYLLWGFNIFQAVVVVLLWELVKWLWRRMRA